MMKTRRLSKPRGWRWYWRKSAPAFKSLRKKTVQLTLAGALLTGTTLPLKNAAEATTPPAGAAAIQFNVAALPAASSPALKAALERYAADERERLNIIQSTVIASAMPVAKVERRELPAIKKRIRPIDLLPAFMRREIVASPTKLMSYAAIENAALVTGVNPKFMTEKAYVESGLNPKSNPGTSSARGIYQIIDSTWKHLLYTYGAKHGYGQYAAAIKSLGHGQYVITRPALARKIMDLRYDPKASSLMAAEYARENYSALKAAFPKRHITVGDLYIAHFMGADGAVAFLQKMTRTPNAAAAPHFPAAAGANRNIFYANGRARSFAAIYDNFARKFTPADTVLVSNPLPGVQLAAYVPDEPEEAPRLHSIFDDGPAPASAAITTHDYSAKKQSAHAQPHHVKKHSGLRHKFKRAAVMFKKHDYSRHAQGYDLIRDRYPQFAAN